MKKLYFGDIEATTEEPITTWLWCIKDILKDKWYIDNNTPTLIEQLRKFSSNINRSIPIIYFFNVKYDASLMLDYLLKNGWGEKEGEHGENGYIETIITEMGVVHSIQIFFKNDNNITAIELKDARLLTGGSISKWGGKLNLPKGETPLKYSVPPNYQPRLSEIEYCKNDVEIMIKAIQSFWEKGMIKDTQSANALYMYKKNISPNSKKLDKKFRSIFPILEHNFSPSYRGGWTFLSPLYNSRPERLISMKDFYWYDVKSMYPSIMRNKYLPYGNYQEFEGEVFNENYIYIYKVEIEFTYKAHVIPFLRLKECVKKYSKTNSLTTEITCIDLQLLKEQANITHLKFLKSYQFNKSKINFKNYIDEHFANKELALTIGDNIQVEIEKILLNGLYGKFGSNIISLRKIPYLNCDKNKISYELIESDERDPIYVPVASFVTSYARQIMVNACISIGFDNVMYGDTDSLFTLIPLYTNVGNKIGQWDNKNIETFNKTTCAEGIFFNTKRYALKDNKEIIKCAGLDSKAKLTYDEFIELMSTDSEISITKSKITIGGIKIYDTTFKSSFKENILTIDEYKN